MLDLTDRQLTLLRRLLDDRLPGRTVLAFGSRVSGAAKPHSDLDLVVLGTMSDLEAAQLRFDLDEGDLPFQVDVVAWDSLPASLREAIAKQSAPISETRT